MSQEPARRVEGPLHRPMDDVKLLAISGSLRQASVNKALLRTFARLAPEGIQVVACPVVPELPLFNPDLEARPPRSVLRLRRMVAESDALLIASPEYAHGVTGVIKNTLDWLVSFELFAGKPVAVLNASPRAHHADDALRETLRTMSAMVVEAASLSFPLVGAGVPEDQMIHQAFVRNTVAECLRALVQALASKPEHPNPTFPIRPD